jgi:thioredoxin-like negative regulator of GroEL
MKKLTFDELQTSIKSFIPTLVEFWSPVCNVCEKAEKYLEELEYAYQNKIHVSKINVNDELQLLELYSIRRIPTFVLFKNSIELARTVGFKDGNDLEKVIRTHTK